MRPQNIFLALAAAVVTCALPQTTTVYYQAITLSDTKPAKLAELRYDPLDPSAAEVVSYDAPELPEKAKLLRVGAYDPETDEWPLTSAMTSVDCFSKGYAPHFEVSVDPWGRFVQVTVRGIKIDAGETRNFGPQATVELSEAGKQPEPNKPVVLSKEGKNVVEEEKSFLQKYTRSSMPACLCCPAKYTKKLEC